MDVVEKARKKEYNRIYRAKHRDELNAKQRKWYADHKDYFRMWRENNREKYNAYHSEYSKTGSRKASAASA